jgi:hypothetical protein
VRALCDKFVFVLYKDEKGEHILACDANGSVTLKNAQERISRACELGIHYLTLQSIMEGRRKYLSIQDHDDMLQYIP